MKLSLSRVIPRGSSTKHRAWAEKGEHDGKGSGGEREDREGVGGKQRKVGQMRVTPAF